ncbi:hypothetical protein [Streptomyces sp. NBC_00576]|uniref:hypothetical protein n=1 Tax=Streptomyces sp. NBC_00576 TaxID=2903665 RepID=UPI003FCE9EC2
MWFRTRTGRPGRDLPKRYGLRETVYGLFRHRQVEHPGGLGVTLEVREQWDADDLPEPRPTRRDGVQQDTEGVVVGLGEQHDGAPEEERKNAATGAPAVTTENCGRAIVTAAAKPGGGPLTRS